MSEIKLFPRFFGNLVIHTSGQASWLQRSSFFHMALSQLGMDRKFVSGRIFGLANLPSKNNIRLYILLFETKVTRSRRCWILSHQMFRSEEAYLEHDKHLGMLCSSNWIESICRKVQISSNGISRRMANSLLILCIERSFYPKFQSIGLIITNFGR